MVREWSVIRVPGDLMDALDDIGLRMEKAYAAGKLTGIHVSDRFGLPTHAVIGRLVQHYQRWRERREKARRNKAQRRKRLAAEGP